MTESEAKTKWCPLVRFSDEGAVLYSMSNRGDVIVQEGGAALPKTTRCIGSACMAFRGAGEKVYCGAFGRV